MATVVVQRRNRNGKKTYPVHYKDPLTLKTVHFKTFRKLKEANLAANELRTLIDSNRIEEIRSPKPDVNLLTFREVAKLKVAVWKDRADLGSLSQSTYQGYRLLVRVINRTFGKTLLCRITKKDILDYQDQLFRELSAISANRSLFVIKQVFQHGVEIGAVHKDPSEGIKYLSEKAHERNKFLMPVELVKLVEASQAFKTKFYMPALIYLGAEHGTSKQEALSLKWSDIRFDFEGQGIITFFRTKNKKERTEFLMPRTKQALLDWKKHLEWMRHRKQTKLKDDRWVFCRLNGIQLQNFGKAWRETRDLAGFPDLHYHDLRHTYCSNLILSGSDLKETKEMIGHSDLSMTDRYSHLTLLHKRACQNRLAAHYENNTEKNRSW